MRHHHGFFTLSLLIALSACRGDTTIGVPQSVYAPNRIDAHPQAERPGQFCDTDAAKRGGC